MTREEIENQILAQTKTSSRDLVKIELPKLDDDLLNRLYSETIRRRDVGPYGLKLSRLRFDGDDKTLNIAFEDAFTVNF